MPRHKQTVVIENVKVKLTKQSTVNNTGSRSYLPYAMEMNVLFHQANVLVNSAK
jgi:hypothetical protein